jgi:thioredoxin-dependent peroxiredoxin
MLSLGARAPDFEVQDDRGERRSLASLTREGPLVLYFYPADFTPGCTKEACELRDVHPRLLAAKLAVAGVSPQDSASHALFRDRYQLPFPLLADPDKAVVRAYDVDGPLGLGVRRVTYLIGRDRIIVDAVRADFRISRHLDFVERALKAAASAGAPAG